MTEHRRVLGTEGVERDEYPPENVFGGFSRSESKMELLIDYTCSFLWDYDSVSRVSLVFDCPTYHGTDQAGPLPERLERARVVVETDYGTFEAEGDDAEIAAARAYTAMVRGMEAMNAACDHRSPMFRRECEAGRCPWKKWREEHATK